MRIFLFPFAGGSSYSFVPFVRALSGRMEPHCVELPGRGRRIREPLLRDMEAIVADAFAQHRHLITEPYCVFGHSMGALSAYLFARKAVEAGLPAPAHLFLSGRGGPAGAYARKQRHLLPKEAFIQELIAIGGISPEIAANAEILDFAEPILRADFQASETYQHRSAPPLDVPITVMVGSDEEVTATQAQYWQRETTGPVRMHTFPGDHFFVLRHVPEIANLLCTAQPKSVSA